MAKRLKNKELQYINEINERKNERLKEQWEEIKKLKIKMKKKEKL